MTDELRELMSNMACPNLETLTGYRRILEQNSFSVLLQEDLSADMGKDYAGCVERIKGELRERLINSFGQDVFEGTCQMMEMLANGVAQGQLGRGRFIARKQ